MTDDIIGLIGNYLRKYPFSEPQDIIKLLYQREFGPAHAIPDPAFALARLRAEYSTCVQESGPALESIGGGFARLDLKRLDANGITCEEAAEWFVKSAEPVGDKTEFAGMLRALAAEAQAEALVPGISAFIDFYVGAGCPAVHHSEAYRSAYSPAYRVIREELCPSK